MKVFRTLIVLVLVVLSGPLMAEVPGDVVVLGDFDDTFQGFGFDTGELVTVDMEAESLPAEIDFIFDLPNGLGMNNRALGSWFSGEATVLDLGDVPLEETADYPSADFAPFLLPEEIIVGHSYLVKNDEGIYSGMFRIVDFDSEGGQLSFRWIGTDQ